ncbi:MAG TPA: hypothetical protein VLJ42_00085 [Solirubrobacteraceae bacterium]|nr:hypothetical protein [Solirubrobacteraceae bacterium]
MATEKSNTTSRHLLYFILADKVPAFAGFALGFQRGNAVIVSTVFVVTAAVDVSAMLFARATAGKGNPSYAARPPLLVVSLSMMGVALITTMFVLELSELSTAFVRAIPGIIGGLLLLAAANRIRHDGRQATDSRSVPDTASNLQ